MALAYVALALPCAGVGVDLWMSNLPPVASCTYVGSGSICDYSTSPWDQRWVGVVLAAAGFGLLPVAWRLDRWPGARPRHTWTALRRWAAPLLWFAVIPVIAGPMEFLIAGSSVNRHTCQMWAAYFGNGGADCPASVFLPSVLIPGLLNLIPLWWLRARDPRTRLAAIVGSCLGIVGLAASLIELHALGPTISWDFGFLLPTLPPTQEAGLAFGTVVWLSTFIALLVIAKLPLNRTD